MAIAKATRIVRAAGATPPTHTPTPVAPVQRVEPPAQTPAPAPTPERKANAERGLAMMQALARSMHPRISPYTRTREARKTLRLKLTAAGDNPATVDALPSDDPALTAIVDGWLAEARESLPATMEAIRKGERMAKNPTLSVEDADGRPVTVEYTVLLGQWRAWAAPRGSISAAVRMLRKDSK
jgi:hypothetical protein